jgi:hypothetical protein
MGVSMSDDKVAGEKGDRPLTLEEHLELVVGGGMRTPPPPPAPRPEEPEAKDPTKPKP